MIPEKILWKVYAGALGAVTTIVSQKVVEGVWKYVTGDEETPQPDDPEISTTSWRSCGPSVTVKARPLILRQSPE
ncbi:DUF4235 domain-containing protein [Streptomyces sp. MAG02]|nr:DUF4235 domain-containing protein [Streptomyces sp. MAG02]